MKNNKHDCDTCIYCEYDAHLYPCDQCLEDESHPSWKPSEKIELQELAEQRHDEVLRASFWAAALTGIMRKDTPLCVKQIANAQKIGDKLFKRWKERCK